MLRSIPMPPLVTQIGPLASVQTRPHGQTRGMVVVLSILFSHLVCFRFIFTLLSESLLVATRFGLRVILFPTH